MQHLGRVFKSFPPLCSYCDLVPPSAGSCRKNVNCVLISLPRLKYGDKVKIHDAGKLTRETSEQGKLQAEEILLDLGNSAS